MTNQDKHSKADSQFIYRVRTRLKAWDDALPADISGRLRASRRDALTGAGSGAHRRSHPWRMAGVGLAVTAGVAWLALGQLRAPHNAPRNNPIDVAEREVLPGLSALDADDWSMIARGDDVQLYEDLEFFLWLDESDDARS